MTAKAAPRLPGWQKAILTDPRINAPVTAENLAAINAWQRGEGGIYENNPFNTTLKSGHQVGGTNSAGVRGYDSPQAGIDATVRTLTNGFYPNILSAFRKGDSAKAVLEAVADSPWGSGRVPLDVLAGQGYTTVTGGQSVPGTSATPVTHALGTTTTTAPMMQQVAQPNQRRLFAQALLGNISEKGQLDAQGLVGALQAQPRMIWTAPQMTAPQPQVTGTTSAGAQAPTRTPQAVKFTPGDPIGSGYETSVGPEHDTGGLPGYPAHDYMAPSGSPVVAPVGGTIVRFSGHDPAGGPTDGVHGPFGWSEYLQGDDGRSYYLTHLGSRTVRVGDRVRAGQLIGTVGDYARWGGASHVHLGVSG